MYPLAFTRNRLATFFPLGTVAASLLLYHRITASLIHMNNTSPPDQVHQPQHLATLWLRHWPVAVLVIVHGVGIAGLSMEWTRPWFLLLTPLNLLLAAGIVLYTGKTVYTSKHYVALGLVTIAGYLVEVVGVNTGLIFGHYWYGPVLGFQVINTPLLIGVNWLILVSGTLSLVSRVKSHFIASLLGAAGMTSLDYVIEPVAVSLNFWQWQDGIIPFQNFIGWFVTSWAMILLSRQSALSWQHQVAQTLLYIQLGFFAALWLLL